MLKSLVISLIVAVILTVTGYRFLSVSKTSFDEEVVNVTLSESTRVVGYKVSKGGATVPYYYHYYFLSSSELPNKSSPFLKTTTDSVEVYSTDEDRIQIKVRGEIVFFTNEIWATVNGELRSLIIDIDAEY